MFNIGDFFNRVQGFRFKEVLIRTTIVEVIKKILNTDIPTESIVISSTVIKINGISSALRSEIFIKKKALLEEINAKQNIKIITDIR